MKIILGLSTLLMRSIARRGLLRTLWLGLLQGTGYASNRGLKALDPDRVRETTNHPFDQEYEVDTGGLLLGHELRTGHANDKYSVGYYAVAPSVFRQTCHKWMATLPPNLSVEDYTFIDVGAGKGRALLLASEMPFREVIGIEFSQALAQIALTNVEKWKAAGRGQANIRIVQQEVTEYEWPQGPLVLFLYNPFGHKIVRRTLECLRLGDRTRSTPVDILYANPDCAFVLERHPAISRLWSEHVPASATDKAADLYSRGSELVTGYRSPAA